MASYKKGKMIIHFKVTEENNIMNFLKVNSVLDSAFCFLYTAMLTMQTNERVQMKTSTMALVFDRRLKNNYTQKEAITAGLVNIFLLISPSGNLLCMK